MTERPDTILPEVAPDSILLEREGPLATLTLNRPAARNALDYAMMAALVRHTAALAADPALRCVVVRGAGGHFMAGGDLRTFAGELSRAPEERKAAFTQVVRELNAAIETLDRLACPVVAVAQGAVAGFGLSLLAACDLALASEDAYFSSAYRHVGLTPDGGMSWSLPRAVGARRAMEIVLLGERFDAHEACRIGLVNRVVRAAELEATLAELVRKLVAGPAEAITRMRRLLRQSPGASLSVQLEAEAVAFGASTGTADFEEGIRAFLEKRTPAFRGG
jgi:2-(1,2-epoxy-1,2-dihydrophenyl)acetyl-CoA isomerase